MAAWPLQPELVIAQLYDRDNEALSLWDAHGDPSFVGLCGTDSHGWIAPALNMRAWYVVLDTPPPLDNRAAAILATLQQGDFHCVAGLLGRNPSFAFLARRQGGVIAAHPGATIFRQDVDELAVTAPTGSSGPSQIVLYRNGIETNRTVGNTMVYANPEPGVYRVEIRTMVPNLVFGSRWAPVIYSNRIRVMPAPPLAPAQAAPAAQ